MDAKILERCMDRIQGGEATLEDCLRDYPDQAPVLELVLQAAALTRDALAPPGPTEAFRASSEARVLNLMRARLAKTHPARRNWSPIRGRLLTWQPAYRLVSASLTVALIAGTAGVAYASGEALPGDSLYGVKRGVEQAALVLSPRSAWDARLQLAFAGKRLEEVEALVELGRAADLGAALNSYEAALAAALELGGTDQEALDRLGAALDQHEEALARVMEKAPERAKPAISEALERSRQGKKAVEQVQQGEHPSESAPGQLTKTPDAEKQKSKPPKAKDRTPGPPATLTPGTY